MRRISAGLIAALTGAVAVSAHAETRAISWQGQAIEANVGEPTRGLGPSRDELFRMAREAVPMTNEQTAPKAAPQTGTQTGK
jgi:hypothetical protein